MRAAIRAIEYYLPAKTVSTEDLATQFPGWSVAKIVGLRRIRLFHACIVA